MVYLPKSVLCHTMKCQCTLNLCLKKVFPLAKRGIAFNVMSKQVDWERNDLFHLSLDEMSSFVTKHLSRHFVVSE